MSNRQFAASQSRSLHLLDAANLCGVAAPSLQEHRLLRKQYEHDQLITPGDLVWVADDVQGACDMYAVWPGMKLLFGRGPDGAENVILENLDRRWVAKRFGQVVIGSGDHRFVDVACELHEAGLVVAVVIGGGRLSWQLRRQADWVHVLGIDPPRGA